MEYNVVLPLKRFFKLLKVDKREILSIYIYAIFNGLVALVLPLCTQAIINLIATGEVSSSWIVLVAIVVTGVAFIGVMYILQMTISENIQQKLFARSAFEFAFRIPRIKLRALENTYVPELANRFFDTLTIQKGLYKILLDFSSAILQVILGLLLLSVYNVYFIIHSSIAILIVFLVFRFTAKKGLISSLKESTYKYKVAHWLQELSRTQDTFKMSPDSTLPLNKTDEEVSSYLKYRKTHFRILVIQFVGLVGFKVIMIAGLLIFGGLLVINGQMNIGQFVAAEIIVLMIVNSIEKIMELMYIIYDVLTSVEKMGLVSDLPLDCNEGEYTTSFTNKHKGLEIELSDLSFSFSNDVGSKMLRNINLTIKAGEKVCVAGYNYSGRSVLMRHIAALYDDYSGCILFNGISLDDWKRAELRKQIGSCLSKEEIFAGTIMENITVGRPDVSEADVFDIANVLDISSFIKTQKNAYDTLLVAEGKGLPEQIRLKIILARSIVIPSQLILIGDLFNYLNKADKNRFLDYTLNQNTTVIVTSNDAEVAERFDRVLVLDEGNLIADNHHRGLKNLVWYNEVFQTK